jgi:hypothetical protein
MPIQFPYQTDLAFEQQGEKIMTDTPLKLPVSLEAMFKEYIEEAVVEATKDCIGIGVCYPTGACFSAMIVTSRPANYSESQLEFALVALKAAVLTARGMFLKFLAEVEGNS